MNLSRAALLLLLVMLARPTTPVCAAEFGFDLWDWTAPCRDLGQFRIWAADLKSIGVTRLEISAPWNLLEPQPNHHDLSFISERLTIARSLGLGLRIRINSYYQGATPTWYTGDFWRDIKGNPPTGTPNPPSITDERFWKNYAPLCAAIARQFKGEDIYYNAFIGIHAELKFADWWNYDPSTLALWRKSIQEPRPQWLLDVAGDAQLPETPPIPPQTRGTPDNSDISKAHIAFREHVWRFAVERFNAAIKAGDPDAKISAPLGEAFRRQSAAFSNQDYFGLSRGASQVVHSYDFYWHPKDPAWMAGAAVASLRGITGIDNVAFEFDGPALTDQLKYSLDHLTALAQSAADQGAGIKAANYSYYPRLPSGYPALRAFAKVLSASKPPAPSKPSQTILLFVSKWANYCYREETEWLHEAQFAAWQMLREKNFPVRFICEDNLSEDLSNYRGLYVAFSPPDLLPFKDRERLRVLCNKIPSIVEFSKIPAAPATQPATTPPTVSMNRISILDYPLAYIWLHAKDTSASESLLDSAIAQTWKSP